MNYQELVRIAPYQPWAADDKAAADQENQLILANRQVQLDRVEGIKVGDSVIDGDKTLRAAHDWGDSVQLTDGTYGASFYLSDGYVTFSGGLNPGIDKSRFIATNETRKGPVWFFSQNCVMAHNGFHTEAMFRVWRLIA